MDQAEWISEAHIADQYETGGDPEGERIRDLTVSERDALIAAAMLRDDTPSGADLIRQLKEWSGPDGLAEPTVYLSLQQLRDRGLIMTHELNGRTKAYRPTPAALDLLDDHVAWIDGALSAGGER